MVPLFRSLISIPAGIERMSVWKFLLLTFGGSLIWNTVFVLAGFYLGENWHVVEQYAGILQKAVIASVALASVWWVAAKVTKRRRKAAAT
jgi:membrane protein DedA with SNARE-associated domain